jgi:hypothetical protein
LWHKIILVFLFLCATFNTSTNQHGRTKKWMMHSTPAEQT